MTKTKVESNPVSNAGSSHHARDGQDKDYGDGSSLQQSGQMTSKQPPKTNSTPIQSQTKEINSAKSKRGSAGTVNIRRATNGAVHMKQESIKRPEKSNQSTRRRNRSKSSGRRKLSDASITSDDVSKDSGKLSSTDSSSEISDSSEDHKHSTNAHCGEPEVSYCGADEEMMNDSIEQISRLRDEDGEDKTTLSPGIGFGEGSISPGDQRSYVSLDSRLNYRASLAFSDVAGDFTDGVHEDLMREIEDLRSENEYLKDEMEELRSEMLEMRDIYMEEDVYQLQELQQQLDQANKACRILQYRLRKAERRSLRIAQTGQVDGELIRTLEHDIRVGKSVSLRLHVELEAIQKKSSQLEWENQELRERLQSLEVAKQVLQTEMDRSRENSLKRRSIRSTSGKSDKKLFPQDDSADLKCQLHFAKEESALMCKKLTKMAMESETMREELAKYRLLYGEVDEKKAKAGTVKSAHTREAETKVHLRLVEEEATLLSRRIVELEVENRGLRSEMSELREKGGAGLEEDELMKVAGEGLALPTSTGEQEEMLRGGHLDDGEKTNENMQVDQTNSEEEGVENSFMSHIHREGPIGGEQELSDESRGEGKAQCALGVKDLEGLLAVHDQALLVRSTIQFLTAPAKNGLSSACTHTTPPGSPHLNKTEVDPICEKHQWLLDPMLSPLTNGLEVLQAQLRALVEKFEMLLDTTPEGPAADLEQATLAEEKDTRNQAKQEHPGGEEHFTHPGVPHSNGCDQDSLVLLTLQLRWFLQQWRQGEKPGGDGKNMFEMYCPNDLCLLTDTESLGCKNTPQEECKSQVSSALLSDLRAVLQNLFDELLEEHRAAQHVTRQFANAKSAWAVECAELKSLISRLKGTAGKVEARAPLDQNTALQKDHIEKLKHLLAESYAAVMDLTKRLKVHERNWSSERQELLQHLNHMKLECKGSKATKQNKKMQSGGCRKTENVGNMQRTSLKTVMPKSNKSWKYLSQEAALLDREGPCKTWDCPIMPPSFPGLNLSENSTPRSNTAPERTSIRIYYSPPSAKRIQMRSVMAEIEEDCEKSHEPRMNAVSYGLVNQDWITSYETWLRSLPIECQSLVERDSVTSISSQFSFGLRNSSVGSPSHLVFGNLDVSANLSDDMKEITASVLQTSQSSSLERRTRDSGSSVLNVISKGTQTQSQPQVTTVGQQTDGPQNLYATKHWSPRVTSFVSARTQQVSASLDRVPGLAERLQPHGASPKIQRRHSASTAFSSKSSSSTSSFTTSSLSSSSSLTSSSRLEYGNKERGLWTAPQRCSPGSAWTRSTTCRSSSTSAPASDKPGSRKNVGIHKYGLVQEFLRNVCGRGEKTNPEEEKAPAARRDNIGLVGSKKSEQPPSRIPAVPLVRNDSITKIVNRRFMKQGQKEDSVCSQSYKGSVGKNKSLEDGACECSSPSLTSCFTRHSHKNIRHGQNKPRPREYLLTGGKGEPVV